MKSTGKAKVYHLYRCSNSRKVHIRKEYVSEDKIWEQFEPAIEALSISQEFAQDITNALNETHEKQKAAIRKQMEGFKRERNHSVRPRWVAATEGVIDPGPRRS